MELLTVTLASEAIWPAQLYARPRYWRRIAETPLQWLLLLFQSQPQKRFLLFLAPRHLVRTWFPLIRVPPIYGVIYGRCHWCLQMFTRVHPSWSPVLSPRPEVLETWPSPVFVFILSLKLKSPVTLLFNAHLLVCFSQSAKHFQTETGGRNYLEL